MRAGKAAVLPEASDILALRHMARAAIDLDALGLTHLPLSASHDEVMYRNLQSVCKNYSSLGARRFFVARATEDGIKLELCRGAVSATNTVVCRLAAGIETMLQRVKMRAAGVRQREYVARVAEWNVTLDRARLEDFAAASEDRSLTEVAHKVLLEAGWFSN
jgi:hypothetical protein